MDKSKLIGLITSGGWTVIGTRDPGGRPTSSCSSLTYIAEDQLGNRAFTKALDVSISFQLNEDAQDALEAHKIRLDRFLYEWKLAEQCNDSGLSGVVRVRPQPELWVHSQSAVGDAG